MIPADGDFAEWREDVGLRERLHHINDKTFYRQYPELAPFDNGEGFWTAGLNRNVEMQEFMEHGRQILQAKPNSTSDETEVFRVAADKLLKILNGYGNTLARYYLSEVLENSVASRLLEIGARRFYVPYFRPFANPYVWESSRGFVSGARDAVDCNPHNWVSFDGKATLTIRSGDSDWTLFADYKSGKEKGGGPCCIVSTNTYDISQITDHRVLTQMGSDIVYIKPAQKRHDRHFSQERRDSWSEPARNLAIGLAGIQNPDPDSLWRAMLLNEYLGIRAECVTRFCEPPNVRLFDHFLLRPMPPIPPQPPRF